MNPFSVDQAYIVSVQIIDEIFDSISGKGNGSWWIETKTNDKIILVHSPYHESWPDGVLSSGQAAFEFPIVGTLPFPKGEGILVCLYPPIRRTVSMTIEDVVIDWEKFWKPIVEELQKRHSGGPSSNSGRT